MYVSHSGRRADGTVEWFVVQPNPQGLRSELASLCRAGRQVWCFSSDGSAAPIHVTDPKRAECEKAGCEVHTQRCSQPQVDCIFDGGSRPPFDPATHLNPSFYDTSATGRPQRDTSERGVEPYWTVP